MLSKQLSIPLFIKRRDISDVEYRIDGLVYDYRGNVARRVGEQIKVVNMYNPELSEGTTNIFLGLEPPAITNTQRFINVGMDGDWG